MPIRIGDFVVAPLPRISYFSLARYLKVLEYGSVGGLVAGSIEKASKIPKWVVRMEWIWKVIRLAK